MLHPYEEMIGLDAYTRDVAPGAGQVYALADLGFSTPLPTVDVNGIPVELTVDPETGFLPSFNVEGHTEVRFKSGDFTKVLVTTRAIPSAPGDPGKDGADGQDGKDGLPGVNAVPAAEATAAYLSDPDGPANAVLKAQSAQVAEPIAQAAVASRMENRPITLRDADDLDFTGTTDSSAALQAHLDAAGARPVELGRDGKIRLDYGITIPSFQTFQGPIVMSAAPGSAAVNAELSFRNLADGATGITAGHSAIVKNILLRGPGADTNTTGVSNGASGSPRFEQVSMYLWGSGHHLEGAYYTVFDRCEWRYNNTAGYHTNCYNLQFLIPRVLASSSDGLTYGAGFIGAARAMTVYGGSMENYGVRGAFSVAPAQVLNVRDVYFEVMDTPAGAVSTANSWGIIADGGKNMTVNLTGNMVYLNYHNRWVHMSGATQSVINSKGNHFVAKTGLGTTPVAYNLPTTGITGEVGPDNWGEVQAGAAAYAGNLLSNTIVPNFTLKSPSLNYYGDTRVVVSSPEGVISANPGAIVARSGGGAGTSMYVKESGTGNTGWVAK